MGVSAEDIKQLRASSGAGIMDCKAALVEAKGDLDKAVTVLRKKGLAKAAKKASRTAREGVIEAYVHTGARLGVLVEINCETDFASRSDDFRQLARDLAMQVAAAEPRYVRREEVSEVVLAAERDVYTEQARKQGKPEKIIERIVDGRVNKFYSEVCLLEQPFVKDGDLTVGDLVSQATAKFGENIVVKRFVRFKLGESDKGAAKDPSGDGDD